MTQRIVTGVILSAGAVLLIYFGGVVFAIAGVLCFAFALYEEYNALNTAGHRPVAWPTWVAMAVSIPLSLGLGAKVVIPILMAASLITIVCVLFRAEPKLEDALMSLLPLFSVMLPGLCVISLSQVEPLSVQRTLIALLVTVPVLGDTLAYFAGSAIGGPKFCPVVSPKKTWAGAIGGMAGSLVAAAAVRLIAGWLVTAPTTVLPGWLDCVLLGLLGGVVSQMGDLFASLVKRHCGVKDFANLFPGHGGMLDRLDSITFMALLLFCYRLLIFG